MKSIVLEVGDAILCPTLVHVLLKSKFVGLSELTSYWEAYSATALLVIPPLLYSITPGYACMLGN